MDQKANVNCPKCGKLLAKILKGGFNPTVFFPYKLFLDKFELISSFKLSPFAIVERYRRKS